MESLRRRRTGIILLSLGYFLCLLAVGTAVFLNDAGPVTAYGLIAFCAAVYLLLVRPAIRRYTGAVREAVLEHVVCQDLEGFCYSRKEGISPQVVRDSGLLADNSGKAFASREHITGHKGGMEVELADVAFPIEEESQNSMFNGACLCLRWPGADFPAVEVRQGNLEGLQLPKGQMELLEDLGALIPGSLYLRAGGESITVLLRGRFLGSPINPLMPVTEQSMAVNPFPEAERLLALASLMRLGRRATKG